MNTKDLVYETLLKADGAFVSGQELAEGLGITRAAVWKAVRALMDSGVALEAVRHHGYRIVADSYDGATISALSGMGVVFLDEVASTNDEARRLVSSGRKAPFVVVAGRQSGGKGRRGRSFASPDGGIYMSIVVPSTVSGSIESITTRTALGVARAVESLGVECAIKWVNDIYVGSRKAVGILCEGVMSMEDHALHEVVIGIGVNYTTPSFPDDVSSIATSLFADGNAPVSPARYAARQIHEVMKALEEPGYIDEYRRRCFVLGLDVDVITPSGTRRARALDVDDQAHLVVRYEDGSVEHLSSGEVSIRKV